MTEERKQELKKLLEEAMACSEIRNSTDSLLSIERYKENLQKRWTYYSPDSLWVMMEYKPYITDENIKSKLLDFIKEELTSFIEENEILSASYFILGYHTDRFQLDKFMDQLLRISVVHGIDRAVSDFDRCTKKEQGSFQALALVEGIKLKEDVQVCQGIRLVPLSNSSSKLPEGMPDPIMPIYGLPDNIYRGKTLLIVDCNISPIFHKPLSKTFLPEIQNNGKPLRLK